MRLLSPTPVCLFLSGYLEYLIKCNFSSPLPGHVMQHAASIEILTPEDIRFRGSQLSLRFSCSVDAIHKSLTSRGVVVSNS